MTALRRVLAYAMFVALATVAPLTSRDALAVTGVVIDASTLEPVADAIVTTAAGVVNQTAARFRLRQNADVDLLTMKLQ